MPCLYWDAGRVDRPARESVNKPLRMSYHLILQLLHIESIQGVDTQNYMRLP